MVTVPATSIGLLPRELPNTSFRGQPGLHFWHLSIVPSNVSCPTPSPDQTSLPDDYERIAWCPPERAPHGLVMSAKGHYRTESFSRPIRAEITKICLPRLCRRCPNRREPA